MITMTMTMPRSCIDGKWNNILANSKFIYMENTGGKGDNTRGIHRTSSSDGKRKDRKEKGKKQQCKSGSQGVPLLIEQFNDQNKATRTKLVRKTRGKMYIKHRDKERYHYRKDIADRGGRPGSKGQIMGETK